ncbi:MAG: 2-amino-4-hydroxy-6-hydroxymethyldihydropteridine diphosphokinase [Pseudomonadota bacterium]|nr:2-amino-4-hydroxy-6-hydroxymethyldihydropteridine diphosphokinase [Pseudomonadales bacterium]MDY6919003.1 2-amino-4-hydroxy-6-hydroxymethyldihydropteridine diphosphokinase [Pseudomonadota bacterium]
MARVYLSLGSNIQRRQHLGAGLEALRSRFGALDLSPVYESEAIGFDGDPFYNLVAGLEADLSVGALQRWIREVEAAHGRAPNAPKFSSRTLDIDILTYDDWVGQYEGVQLPRPDILTNAYVLLPLADVAGDQRHPITGLTYARLWADYDKSRQRLWPVTLDW